MNFAAAHADPIAALREGVVVASGLPAQILRTSVRQRVYDLEVPVVEVDGQPVAVYVRESRLNPDPVGQTLDPIRD